MGRARGRAARFAFANASAPIEDVEQVDVQINDGGASSGV
jgi:hypothetical protein